MKNNYNNESRHQNAEELLKEALSLWKKDGYYDDDNENSQFYNIAKDPIVKLFMIALSHQTNNLKDEIFWLKENLLEEFIEKIIPYNLIKPIPSFTIIETAKEDSIDYDCYTSAETKFILEKEKARQRAGDQENDIFEFIPLLKTKIIKGRISSVQKRDNNIFSVTLSCSESIKDLSGIAFCFLTKVSNDLSISVNGKKLPLIKPEDYENLPFIEWFDYDNMIFDQSLMYGSKNLWLDIFAVNNIQYFIIDKYDPQKISLGNNSNIELVFEFFSSGNFINIDEHNVKINCVPIVNVEKQAVSLSGDEPIKKIGIERSSNNVNDRNGEKTDSTEQKLFLNLLEPLQPDIERNDFTIRRFGMERFNKNELLLQINSIINKYTSDYYAFMKNDELKDGDKIKNLNLALKEVVDELKKQDNPGYGIYLILNQGNAFSELKKSIEVSYLLTDGSRANGINTTSMVSTPIQFDGQATRLIMETRGGNDMVINYELKKKIAQYNFLTNDRLVTKSDIKSFCIKELLTHFNINKEHIENIEVRNEFTPKERVRYIHVKIQLKKLQTNLNTDEYEQISNHLKRMIEIRSTNLFPIMVKLI